MAQFDNEYEVLLYIKEMGCKGDYFIGFFNLPEKPSNKNDT